MYSLKFVLVHICPQNDQACKETSIHRCWVVQRWACWLIEAEWCIYASVNQVSIGSDNGLSPILHQAITWTNARILSIGPLWTNSSEILIEIHIFSLNKMHLWISNVKWQPFCLALNVLSKPTLGKTIACHLLNGNPSSDAILAYCKWDHWEQIVVKCDKIYYYFHRRKWISKHVLRNT